jgi:hypothetical protein
MNFKIKTYAQMLDLHLGYEEIIGNKTYLSNGERVTSGIRRKLDEAMLAAHISTCPFAKLHKHEVGPVEQLEAYEIRYAKEIAEAKREAAALKAKQKENQK